MKRLLSLILCAVMLCTVIVPIKSVEETEKTTLYSGGSGTEDDPYLISTAADIEAIYNYYSSIESREVGAPQLHFKLTKDLTINKPISCLDCYVYDMSEAYSYMSYYGPGYDTYRASPFETKNYEVGSAIPEKNINSLLEKYGDLYVLVSADDYFYGDPFRWVTSRQAFLSIKNEQEFEEIFDVLTGSDYPLDLRGTKWSLGITEQLYIYNKFYFNATFAGVFDGNGYTIFFEPSYEILKKSAYLFGSIGNGAVVKNLNVVGDGISLAYELEEGGLVENCTIDSGKKYMSFSYYQCYTVTKPGYDQYYYDFRFVEEGGNAIAYNYGTVRNCYNRSSLAGKLSNDSDVNTKDVNIMRRILVGIENEPESIRSDINIDGRVDAKDVHALLRVVLGV